VAAQIARKAIVVVANDRGALAKDDLEALAAVAGDVVVNREPYGYGANLNRGAARLRGRYPYYLFLNDDTVVQAGAIAALADFLDRHPSAAVAGPRIVGSDGAPQAAAFRFPSLASELAWALILPARWQLAFRRRVSAPDLSGLFPLVDWVLGAAFLVRSEAFHAVAGFDESYFLYSEETDLAYRLRLQGWSSHLVQRAAVSHVGRTSSIGREYERRPGLSRWKFIKSHWSRRERIALASLLPVVYLWNSLYVIARILLSPRSLKEKSRLWREHWLARPVP
jgi:GT2 family glycosyltransferase